MSGFSPATSNCTSINYISETDFNVTPDEPELTRLRITGEGLSYNINTETSQELRCDRAITDLVQTSAEVTGDVNFELSYASFDDFIEAALCGTWSANKLKNGKELRSFTIQKKYGDADPVTYQNFTGVRIGGFDLSFDTGAILTGSFNLMGCQSNLTESQFASGSIVESAGVNNSPMNAVTNVSAITKNGSPMAKIQSLSLSLNNNLRGQDAIGSLGHVGIALGRLDLTGNLNLYFENSAEYHAFLNSDKFSLEFAVQDELGQGYTFTLPRVKYSEANVTAGSVDEDLMISATYTALYDESSNCVIEIERHNGLQPAYTSGATITGTYTPGNILTANPGTWTNAQSFTYQWISDNVEVVGATNSTYTVTVGDSGKRIDVAITAHNGPKVTTKVIEGSTV